MHTNEKREDPLVELGYEIRDVDYKRLPKAVISFLIFGVCGGLVGAFIYTNRFLVLNIQEPRPGINAELSRRTPPPGTPLIQDNVNSKTDIAVLRKAETKRLGSTEYLDDKHEYVRIPIDRAMDLIVKNGVHAQTGPVDSVDLNTLRTTTSVQSRPVDQVTTPTSTATAQPGTALPQGSGTAPATTAPTTPGAAPFNPPASGTTGTTAPTTATTGGH